MIRAIMMFKVNGATSFFVHVFIFWNLNFISCAVVPGIENSFSENCGEIDATYASENHGSAPWTVAVGQLDEVGETRPKSLQTGVIVHPNVVLTVFEVSEEGWYVVNGERVDVTNLIVVAGTEVLNGTSADANVQGFFIDLVIPYVNPAYKKFQLVLLKFHQPLDLSGPFAGKICLPLKHVLPALKEIAVGTDAFALGFVAGTRGSLESSSKNLGYLNWHILAQGDSETCTKKFREAYLGETGKAENVSCAWQHVNVEQPDCGALTQGTSLSVEHEGRTYLTGLAGLISMKETSDTSCTLFFYDFLLVDPGFQNWLLHAIKCASLGKMGCPSGECIPAEKICNHQEDCGDGSGQDEEAILCRHLHPGNSTFYCGFNDATIPWTKVCDKQRDCIGGADELQSNCQTKGSELGTPSLSEVNGSSLSHMSKPKAFVPHCLLPQYPKGIKLSCSKDDEDVPCMNITKGTKLELTCNPWYIPVSRVSSVEMTCTEDGTWVPFKQLSCQAVCGRLDVGLRNQQAFISFGNQVSKAFSFPWHAALFFWDRKSRGYLYGCGGSLIENSFILTAAHCVRDPSGAKRDKRKMLIVLSPVSSVLEENTEEEGSVVLGVDDFWTPPTYDVYSLASDIALVKLNDSVEYSEDIQPVCYLNENSARPQKGELGLAAGFGKQETGIVSEGLRWASFPVISDEQCSDKLGAKISTSEFCAGFRNGTAVCEGDSGGGLVFKQFPDSEQSPYSIKGIVSRGLSQKSPSCSVNEVAVFTHVDSFASWLLERLSQLDIYFRKF